MTILEQDMARTAAYIISEAAGHRSRDQGLVGTGADVVKAGTVMGKITADGKLMPLDTAAVDGTEAAAGILYQGCDATSADVRRTYTARDTEASDAQLTWPDGISAGDKATAIAELAALGIIVR